MHGNVWEWCRDVGSTSFPSEDGHPISPEVAGLFRGGGWRNVASFCRSARRLRTSADYRIDDIGFRVALCPADRFLTENAGHQADLGSAAEKAGSQNQDETSESEIASDARSESRERRTEPVLEKSVGPPPAAAADKTTYYPKIEYQFYENDRVTVSQRSPTMPYVIDETDGEWCRIRDWWTRKEWLVSYEDAAEYYTNVIRSGENRLAAVVCRGHVYRRRGDLRLAIVDYTDGINLNQKTGFYTRIYRAAAYYKLKQTDKALADLREVVRLSPGYEHASHLLAWLLATAPEKKYRDGKQALTIVNVDVPASDRFGQLLIAAAAHAELRQFDQALMYQKQCIALLKQSEQNDVNSNTRSHWIATLLANAEERQSLFKEHKPYRDTARTMGW
jgi:tetratricopeptide (TPR) repeat protein